MEEPTVKVDPNPSPEAEANDFSTPDERAEAGRRKHELELLDRQQGKLGGFLGTTNTNLKIAFVIVIIAGTGFILTTGSYLFGNAPLEAVQACATLLGTVSGYIFGVKSSE